MFPFAISKEFKDIKECTVCTWYRIETNAPNYKFMTIVSSEALSILMLQINLKLDIERQQNNYDIIVVIRWMCINSLNNDDLSYNLKARRVVYAIYF